MSYFMSTKPITEAGKTAAGAAQQGNYDIQQLMGDIKREFVPYQAYAAPSLFQMGDLLGIKTPPSVQNLRENPEQTKIYPKTNFGGWDVSPDIDPAVFEPLYNNFSDWYKSKYKRDFTLGGMEGKYVGDFERGMKDLESKARNIQNKR